ncbi:hypothetical protein [Ferrovum myxofaciens]|uniref:hypothetical protein n=1 Tax=Ferrovum myxofaciens TaxID=416213 RepID=UPI003EB7A776
MAATGVVVLEVLPEDPPPPPPPPPQLATANERADTAKSLLKDMFFLGDLWLLCLDLWLSNFHIGLFLSFQSREDDLSWADEIFDDQKVIVDDMPGKDHHKFDEQTDPSAGNRLHFAPGVRNEEQGKNSEDQKNDC